MTIHTNRNFRLRTEWDWKAVGIGCSLGKPIYKPFPRQNYWIGIGIRLLWLSATIMIWERKPDKNNLEAFEHQQRMKELATFHNKELLVFADKSCLDLSWQWNQLGLMIFFRPRNASKFMPGDCSIVLLWVDLTCLLANRQKELYNTNKVEIQNYVD